MPVSFSASGMDRPQRGKRTEKGVSPFSFSLSMHYQVIHHTPGRLRVRSGRCAFNHDQAYGIECRLLKQKGVYSVKATPLQRRCVHPV